MNKIIAVAGATGNLGGNIISSLLDKGAIVHAIVRSSSDNTKIKDLEGLGVKVFKVNMADVQEVSKACIGASCVVSALAGLRDVIIDTQKILLDAAIAVGVPRFIPSDYSLDFIPFSNGENRNLDYRREFHIYLDKSAVASTSIFNGAGDQISPREIRTAVSEISGEKYRLIRAGGPGMLSTIIKISRKISPAENDLYPTWQGMQYMRNMIDERSILKQIDNLRYSDMRWTTIRDVLSSFLSSKG